MFNRPTVQQLIERIRTDVESFLPGSDPRLRRSILVALIRAQAGVAHGLYGYLDWLARQIIPDTADGDILARWAAWWGVLRTPSATAAGEVTFTGDDGKVIPAGTMLQRSDGVEYATDVEATIVSGTATVAVTADSGGADTNCAEGRQLTTVSSVPGVRSSATVAAGGLTGGADIENDDDLRERLRERVQRTPQGGSADDYTAWAKEIAGVTRVWPMRQWSGAGTVAVFFVRDDDASLIPDAAGVQTVQDHIDARRPVTADVTVLAPVAVPVDMTISLNPNSSTVQTAVTNELSALFRRECGVEDGNGSGTLKVSHIREAISLADGEIDNAVVMPSGDVVFNVGEIGVLGAITFQVL